MNWLVLGWFVTCSFVPQNESLVKDSIRTAFVENNNSYESVVGLSLTAFDIFKIWTELDTYVDMNNIISYSPYQSNYRAGAAIAIDPFIIEISHECIHPTISHLDIPIMGYMANSTKISVTMHGSYSLFK